MVTRYKRKEGTGSIGAYAGRNGYVNVTGRLNVGGRTYHVRAVGVGYDPTPEMIREAGAIVEGRLAELRGNLGLGPLARVNDDRWGQPHRIALTQRQRFAVLERCGFACVYCGRRPPEVKLHVDHRLPVSRGGTNDDGNLCAACDDCNLGKGARWET